MRSIRLFVLLDNRTRWNIIPVIWTSGHHESPFVAGPTICMIIFPPHAGAARRIPAPERTQSYASQP